MSQGKSAYYSNEVVLDPEGKTLFRGSAKKIDWYLDRRLAKVVDKGPPRTIQLLFKPNGPGVRGDDYSLAEKETKCVVCGCKDNLTRHHVVPSCYRSQMSPVYKDYNMHEMLHGIGKNWATDLDNQKKNGTFIFANGIDTSIRPNYELIEREIKEAIYPPQLEEE